MSPLLIPGYSRLKRGPQGERCPYPEPFLTYLPVSPVKELPPPMSHPRSLFREGDGPSIEPPSSLKVPVDEPSSRFPNGVLIESDARLQSLFYLTFRDPNMGALPPSSLHRTPPERDAATSEPPSTIFQSPW